MALFCSGTEVQLLNYAPSETITPSNWRPCAISECWFVVGKMGPSFFHTPSSYDYQDKSITNEQIVQGLIASGIVAVAITDHHVIDPKRIKALRSLAGAKLTIFPAIELRSELGGKESVHLIGIFPESADPEHVWTKLQGPLSLTPAEVAEKGR